MTLIPSKKQWNGWSLPSKMTAIGFYIAIIPFIFSVISYLTLTAKQYLAEQISIKSVTLSPSDIKKQTGMTLAAKEADIQINYPTIDYLLPNDFLKRINNELKENVISYLTDNLLEYRVDYEIGLTSKNIISLRVDQYYYYEGAANGNNSQFSINIDPQNQRTIDFFDIFDARRNALNEIKEIIAYKITDVCEYGLFTDKLEKASFIPRFVITPSAIHFIFSEYEITPGVCNGVTVSIGYDELIGYIRNDGPLGELKPQSGSWAAGEHFVDSMMGHMKKMSE
ncbi:hypothetical protein [Pectobacterium sp. B1J-3]|uniref:hypothetical protein n=1 Tax=Pectobacterium sp. B1J-3 TaxID=3385371 RepID=UPI0039058297